MFSPPPSTPRMRHPLVMSSACLSYCCLFPSPPPSPPLTSLSQLLVRLELPFKTVKGVTVDDVAQRLVPCGFYKDSTKMNVQYGEHLLLDNITR